MRIHLKLTANKEVVPYDHQHLMTGKLHKWIGQNELHDGMSMYSFSQLQNGKGTKSGLNFQNGSGFFISSWDESMLKTIIASIQSDNNFLYGMKVGEIILQQTPELGGKSKFQVASPIFIKRKEGDRDKYYLFDEPQSGKLLTETLANKMSKAGLPSDNILKVRFDLDYRNKQTKLIHYKKGDGKISLRCSWCPVIIEGSEQSKSFAWNVGLGNSTGIGFGAIK